MKIKFWGTRGSIPSSGPETQYFGGNTSCVTVATSETMIILDAGSGIRELGKQTMLASYPRLDILLTHLHLDHIQGLGFFEPLYNPEREIHIWGPTSFGTTLNARLNRYLSPPLFPVSIRDLPATLHFHELVGDPFTIGDIEIEADYICHPGPTVGFRMSHQGRVVTYLPDHEPAFGFENFPTDGEWTSGFDLAHQADLLIHDAQFSEEEYEKRIGWGHSTFKHAIKFAQLTGVRELVLFHHDPAHSDQELERLFHRHCGDNGIDFGVSLAWEGMTVDLK